MHHLDALLEAIQVHVAVRSVREGVAVRAFLTCSPQKVVRPPFRHIEDHGRGTVLPAGFVCRRQVHALLAVEGADRRRNRHVLEGGARQLSEVAEQFAGENGLQSVLAAILDQVEEDAQSHDGTQALQRRRQRELARGVRLLLLQARAVLSLSDRVGQLQHRVDSLRMGEFHPGGRHEPHPLGQLLVFQSVGHV